MAACDWHTISSGKVAHVGFEGVQCLATPHVVHMVVAIITSLVLCCCVLGMVSGGVLGRRALVAALGCKHAWSAASGTVAVMPGANPACTLLSSRQAVGSCELNPLVRQPLAGSDSAAMLRIALLKVWVARAAVAAWGPAQVFAQPAKQCSPRDAAAWGCVGNARAPRHVHTSRRAARPIPPCCASPAAADGDGHPVHRGALAQRQGPGCVYGHLRRLHRVAAPADGAPLTRHGGQGVPGPDAWHHLRAPRAQRPSHVCTPSTRPMWIRRRPQLPYFNDVINYIWSGAWIGIAYMCIILVGLLQRDEMSAHSHRARLRIGPAGACALSRGPAVSALQTAACARKAASHAACTSAALKPLICSPNPAPCPERYCVQVQRRTAPVQAHLGKCGTAA